MIKTLICIPNYENRNLPFLNVVLNEYNNFGDNFDISVMLFSTRENKEIIDFYKRIKIQEIIFDKSLSYWLPHQHKKYMASKIEEYDLFIYSEDDIRINQKNIDRFIALSKICEGTSYIPGFLRYEMCPNKDFVSVLDCHPRHSRWVGGNKRKDVIKEKLMIKGNNFFVPFNVHNGSYVLLQDQYKKVISNPNYFNSQGYARALESAASLVYFNCGFKKVISYDFLEESLVHHFSNKYCKCSFALEELKNIYKRKEMGEIIK